MANWPQQKFPLSASAAPYVPAEFALLLTCSTLSVLLGRSPIRSTVQLSKFNCSRRSRAVIMNISTFTIRWAFANNQLGRNTLTIRRAETAVATEHHTQRRPPTVQ